MMTGKTGIAAILTVFLGFSVAFGQEIDKEKIGDMIDAFKSGKDKGKINDLIDDFKNKGTTTGGTTGTSGTGAPVELDMSVQAKPLDEADKQYCEVHIKNAKRNYRQKKFDRALDEIRNVLSVDRNNGEAYFMKSVIEAKRKEFLQAWKDVEKARSILGESPKLTDYTARLQKVSPRPSNLDTLSVGNRPIPTHVSEYAMDLIEVFFTDKDAAAHISGLGWKEISGDGGNSKITFSFKGKDKLNIQAIQDRLKQLSGSDPQDPNEEDSGKAFTLTIVTPHAVKNPTPSSIGKTMDFLDTLSKECDVKVETETESAPDAGKVVQGTYVVMSSGLADLNTFFRKASPKTESFWMENLEYTMQGNQPVWKAKTAIRFQLQ